MSDESVRVLVIDDNPKNLDVLSDLLDKENFVILFALDGKSGLQRAESGQPDLILLDIMMPGIDGFETCRQLKANENTKDIPVIFMTALSKTTNKVKGFALGAVDYITKPIQPEEALARITTHLKIQRLQLDLRMRNEELQAALEREKELNTLKTRFISIASHEFRTPLASISIAADVLKRYSDRMSEEKKTASLERIQKTVKQLTNMLDDVLLLSKVEAETYEFKPHPTYVENICQGVVEDLSVMSAETHTIVFSGTGEQVQASVDPKLLRHILSNLLSNAVKYSPAGSSVHFELARDNESLLFRVKDEGIGISEEEQQHLFDAFRRGANVGDIEGVGLGLSIVKQFVELHGGTISVESEINKGTTFTVIIPIRD